MKKEEKVRENGGENGVKKIMRGRQGRCEEERKAEREAAGGGRRSLVPAKDT